MYTAKDLNLNFDGLSPDWSELAWMGQRAVERETGEVMANFDIPVEAMENPCELYNRSNYYTQLWMDWLLKNDPLEIGRMMYNGTLEFTAQKVEMRAQERFGELFEQYQEDDPQITEELKARDQMRWVQLVSECQVRARRQVAVELAQGIF